MVTITVLTILSSIAYI
ncbi:hypothetical protein GW891_01755 [bacterium]|nr:hypothetical protein [bacterium]